MQLVNERTVCGEPVADIAVSYSGRLQGTTVTGEEIAKGIDEIPILSVAGAFCQGIFSVSGASELRVKESDRLNAIVTNLQAAGSAISEYADGFEIEGKAHLPGGSAWNTFGDHRLAMTGLVLSLLSDIPVSIDDNGCVAISYPDFAKDLSSLIRD